MWTIWKFDVNDSGRFIIMMPSGAHILKIDIQFGDPYMWALVNDKAVRVSRTFVVFGTGHQIPGGPVFASNYAIEIQQEKGRLRYIDTFQIMNGDLVWHLFEVEE